VLTAKAKRKQKLNKPVKLKASCDEACSVVANGTAKPKGSARAKRAKRLKLKRVTAELIAGQTVSLKLKPSKKVARKLKAAAKANVKLALTATDAAGNGADAKLRVKLR
jgi:hypothetical protein